MLSDFHVVLSGTCNGLCADGDRRDVINIHVRSICTHMLRYCVIITSTAFFVV